MSVEHDSSSKHKDGKRTVKNISEGSDIQCRRWQASVISQLHAAAPASLPVNIILRGLRCLSAGDVRIECDEVLHDLIMQGRIVKISEAGLCDRYQLSE